MLSSMNSSEFNILAIVPVDNTQKLFTVYLFSYELKILIPYKVNRWACDSILLAKQQLRLPRPHVHDSYMRTILALGGTIEGIVVYKYFDEVFYSYLMVEQIASLLEIDLKLTDAICLALLATKPIMVTEEVYKTAGIVVTKELIDKSLEVDL